MAAAIYFLPMLKLKVSGVEELKALVESEATDSPAQPLPRCSDEIIERFFQELSFENGMVAHAYYDDIKDVLTFHEFRNLFENMGLEFRHLGNMIDHTCQPVPGPQPNWCKPEGGRICNTYACYGVPLQSSEGEV